MNSSNQNGEILHVIIEQPFIKKCILINVYRPPQGNVDLFTKKIIDNITDLNVKFPNAEIILLGDFNLNTLTKNSIDAQQVKWIEQATGLKQYITGTTRHSNNDSCIDLIFTNLQNTFSTKILDVNISDHQFIYLNRKHQTKPRAKLDVLGRSYKNYDHDLFCHKLLQMNWMHFYQMENVNIAWNIMLTNIKSAIDDMCPLKHFKVAQAKEPWVTNEILELIKDKDKLLRRAKNRNNENDWHLAREARNNANLQIRHAKANFIQENLNINQNNSKKFWQNIHDILPNSKKKNSGKISLKDSNFNFILDDKLMANTLNNYFTTIGPSLAANMNDPWVYDGPIINHTMIDTFHVNTVELLEILNDIDCTKSSAIPYINSRVLKDALICLVDQFAFILNLSFETSIFPDDWKIAQITPLAKDGDLTNCNNYRPISLLPLPGKIAEKIAHNKLMYYFENNNLLNKKQGGFRKNNSTVNSISEFTHKIFSAISRPLLQ